MPRFWLYARNGKRYGADAPTLEAATEAARRQGLDIVEAEPDLPFEHRFESVLKQAQPTSNGAQDQLPSTAELLSTIRGNASGDTSRQAAPPLATVIADRETWQEKTLRWFVPRIGNTRMQRDVSLGILNGVLMAGCIFVLLLFGVRQLVWGMGEYEYYSCFRGYTRLVNGEPEGFMVMRGGARLPARPPWTMMFGDYRVSNLRPLLDLSDRP